MTTLDEVRERDAKLNHSAHWAVKDRRWLIARVDELAAALTRAHDLLRECVTDGVLRHNINAFLSEERAALARLTSDTQ